LALHDKVIVVVVVVVVVVVARREKSVDVSTVGSSI
jgi:hypothetical protein